MTPSITLSVVVICYNQERQIVEGLSSVLAQTAFDRIHEVLVIDDASSDGSAAAAKAIAQDHPKVKVIVRDENSGGAATPRNDGMQQSTGSHVAFLDADDLWVPEKIAASLAVLEAKPEVGLLYSDFVTFDQTGAERRTQCNHLDAESPDQLETIFVHGGPILPSCTIVARTAFERAGYMDPKLRFNEEQEFWLRLLMVTKAQRLPKALVRKREWFGSLGSAKYGLENLNCKREISAMMLKREPRLQKVAAAREAQIEFKTAVHYFTVKNRRAARRHLQAALEIDQGLHKARLYLWLSYFASDPEPLLKFLRLLRSRVPTGARR